MERRRLLLTGLVVAAIVAVVALVVTLLGEPPAPRASVFERVPRTVCGVLCRCRSGRNPTCVLLLQASP